jgi:hypothetical protein
VFNSKNQRTSNKEQTKQSSVCARAGAVRWRCSDISKCSRGTSAPLEIFIQKLQVFILSIGFNLLKVL